MPHAPIAVAAAALGVHRSGVPSPLPRPWREGTRHVKADGASVVRVTLCGSPVHGRTFCRGDARQSLRSYYFASAKGIFLVAISLARGTVTSMTPFLNSALTLSASTLSGKVRRRSKAP